MTRISRELLLKCLGHITRKSEESLSQFLRRITHVYFQEKNISVIENLNECSSLSVLYLYDNRIKTITNLSFAVNMTHLYLQNNSISRIEGLHGMVNLTKLYVGYNNIIVIENLERCTKLKELHVEYQDLPTGEKMLFDPRSLMILANSLIVLNISGNSIESIKDISILRNLTQLSCKDNHLTSMRELSRVLASLTELWKFDIEGNPVCAKPKFRDRVIVMTQSLSVFDGKEVTETSRKFLQNWRTMRDRRKGTAGGGNGEGNQILPPIGAGLSRAGGGGGGGSEGGGRRKRGSSSPALLSMVPNTRQESAENAVFNGTNINGEEIMRNGEESGVGAPMRQNSENDNTRYEIYRSFQNGNYY